MVWVQRKGDNRSNAYMADMLVTMLKYTPTFWTDLHKVNRAPKRDREPELTHIMLAQYSERHETMLQERKHIQQQWEQLEARNTRLYRTNVAQSNRIVDLETTVDDLHVEATRLFNVAMDLIMDLPEDLRGPPTARVLQAISRQPHFGLLADE